MTQNNTIPRDLKMLRLLKNIDEALIDSYIDFSEVTDNIGYKCENFPRNTVVVSLLEHGVIVGYADAFSYDGNGVLLVGESGAGKTSLLNRFAEDYPHSFTRLGENEVLMYLPLQGSPPLLMERFYANRRWLFLPSFTVPELFQQYPLKAIFYIKRDRGDDEKAAEKDKEKSWISIGDISEPLEQMVGRLNDEKKKTLERAFKDVRCYHMDEDQLNKAMREPSDTRTHHIVSWSDHVVFYMHELVTYYDA